MGDAQPCQGRAQLVRQRAQQQALLLQALAQAPGHVLEGLCQFTQLVTACQQGQGGAVQVIGTQGVGAVAQAVQRHYQVPVQRQAQQQGEQCRCNAVGDHMGPRRQAGGQQALGQLQHQAALLGVLRELDADIRQLILQAPAHGPVQFAHEGQVAGLLGAQRRGAEALQVRADHRHPGVLGLFQLPAPGLGADRAALAPGVFSLLRIARQVILVGPGQKIGAALHGQAPGPDQPDQQQAEADLQDRQFPQQRVAPHQGCSVSTRMYPCPRTAWICTCWALMSASLRRRLHTCTSRPRSRRV
ncbi:hypothetical protein D3C76_842040 [compost metagenome]